MTTITQYATTFACINNKIYLFYLIAAMIFLNLRN